MDGQSAGTMILRRRCLSLSGVLIRSPPKWSGGQHRACNSGRSRQRFFIPIRRAGPRLGVHMLLLEMHIWMSEEVRIALLAVACLINRSFSNGGTRATSRLLLETARKMRLLLLPCQSYGTRARIMAESIAAATARAAGSDHFGGVGTLQVLGKQLVLK